MLGAVLVGIETWFGGLGKKRKDEKKLDFKFLKKDLRKILITKIFW